MLLLRNVRALYGEYVIHGCAEHGCKIDTDKVKCIILDGDRFIQGAASCDCLIVALECDLVIVVHVELKSRSLNADSILEKMSNSDEASQSILRAAGFEQWKRCRYLYVVLHKGIKIPEYKILTAHILKLRGKNHRLLVYRCGIKLADLVVRLLEHT